MPGTQENRSGQVVFQVNNILKNDQPSLLKVSNILTLQKNSIRIWVLCGKKLFFTRNTSYRVKQ